MRIHTWKITSALILTITAVPAARADNYTLEANCLTGTGAEMDQRAMRFAADFVAAKQLAQGGYNYFNNKDSPPAPYVKWFGDVNAPDGPMGAQHAALVHLDVENHVRSIKNAIYGWEFSFDCSDPDSNCSLAAAYIVKAELTSYEPMVVRLCPSFWGLQEGGYEGSVNTLVHEISHFIRNQSHDDEGAGLVDGTKDQRSVEQIMALAQANPALLQENAYAHANFLTDNPSGSVPFDAGGGLEHGGGCGCRLSGASPAAIPQGGYLFFAALAILLRRRKA